MRSVVITIWFESCNKKINLICYNFSSFINIVNKRDLLELKFELHKTFEVPISCSLRIFWKEYLRNSFFCKESLTFDGQCLQKRNTSPDSNRVIMRNYENSWRFAHYYEMFLFQYFYWCPLKLENSFHVLNSSKFVSVIPHSILESYSWLLLFRVTFLFTGFLFLIQCEWMNIV